MFHVACLMFASVLLPCRVPIGKLPFDSRKPPLPKENTLYVKENTLFL